VDFLSHQKDLGQGVLTDGRASICTYESSPSS
jgi:hypothetical protein